MARLSTIGFDVEAVGVIDSIGGTGAPTRDTTKTRPRSGPASLKCNSAAGNSVTLGSLSNQSAGGGNGLAQCSATADYRARIYFCFSNLPASDVPIFRYDGGATAQVEIRLRTTGALAFYNTTAGTQIGSDYGQLVTADGTTWWRLELRANRASATSLTDVEALIYGTSIGSATLALTATSGTGLFRCGWVTAPGTNRVLNMDDAAINNTTGTDQNGYPGDGNVVPLFAVSDNARGANWTAGAGGTSNLFDALDNTPPVGVAFNGTNTSQIINAVSDTTGNYDANLTDYTTAGVREGDTIMLVHPLWALGCSSATATLMARLLVSNPQSNGGTESTQSTGAIAGTYGTNWKQPTNGVQVVYSPLVTLGTQPVIRIGKRTASTNVVGACFMGAYVEYLPAIPNQAVALTVT